MCLVANIEGWVTYAPTPAVITCCPSRGTLALVIPLCHVEEGLIDEWFDDKVPHSLAVRSPSIAIPW